MSRDLAPSPSPSPVFVLCTARSGSTLLRLLLDGHPEIACPAETNISNICSAIGFTTASTLGTTEEATEVACAAARHVAEMTLGGYAKSEGKSRWADKSLASTDDAELLLRIFPNAHFICLYRDCRDTVASLHEVCAWGYSAFGVESYARQFASNLAAGLVTYWVDKISGQKAFEDEHPDRCVRLRYEDLAKDPASALRRVFSFIGAADDELSISRALDFSEKSKRHMPGDIKVRFTTQAHTDSIGRGWTVPVEMLPEALRARVNELSEQLGYAPLPDLAKTVAEGTPLGVHARHGELSPETVTLVTSMVRRAAERLVRTDGSGESHRGTIKLVIADAALGPWVIDFEGCSVTEGDLPADWVALTDTQTLLDLTTGKCNLGSALRGAMLQLATAGEEHPMTFLDRAETLLEVLRV